MRDHPAPAVQTTRHQRLRFNLATDVVKGRVLDRWQIEVTGSGRIWYLVDHEERTIWIDYAGTGHPRQTA
jgi:hypothetical protein